MFRRRFPEEFGRTACDVNVMCGPQSDRILPHKTKQVLLGKPLYIIHLARLPGSIHRTQNPPGFGPWGFDSPPGTIIQNNLLNLFKNRIALQPVHVCAKCAQSLCVTDAEKGFEVAHGWPDQTLRRQRFSCTTG